MPEKNPFPKPQKKLIAMRKYLLIAWGFFIGLFIFPSQTIMAQGGNFSNARVFNAGLSLNYSYDYIGSRSLRVPPMVAFFEVGIHQYITAGPYLAYSKWIYSEPERTRSFLGLGARGSFHLTPFLNDLIDGSINEEEFDFYVSMISGFEFRQYGSYTEHPVSDFFDNIRLFIGPVAGVRYYFSDDLAVFSEVGRGALGAVGVGLSVNL